MRTYCRLCHTSHMFPPHVRIPGVHRTNMETSTGLTAVETRGLRESEGALPRVISQFDMRRRIYQLEEKEEFFHAVAVSNEQATRMSSGSVNQLVAAGFLVFRRIRGTVEYLFLQTSYGQNHWTPPKGHVDPGESELETAYRETQEEAGLTRDQLHIVDGFRRTLRYEVRGAPKRVEYWLSELKVPEAQVKLSEEHVAFKWLALDAALELISDYEDMQKVVQEAEEYIQK